METNQRQNSCKSYSIIVCSQLLSTIITLSYEYNVMKQWSQPTSQLLKASNVASVTVWKTTVSLIRRQSHCIKLSTYTLATTFLTLEYSSISGNEEIQELLDGCNYKNYCRFSCISCKYIATSSANARFPWYLMWYLLPDWEHVVNTTNQPQRVD